MRSKFNVSGIYVLTSPSGGAYVGSAVLVRRRWHQHKIELRANRHANFKLQKAWDKYGESAMRFSLILQCRREDLVFFEQRAIDILKPRYNIALVVGSAAHIEWTPERRASHSARLTGKKDSDETRARKSAAGVERHKKYPASPETIAKISSQRWTHSDEAKAKMRGRVLSAGQVEAIRKRAIGNKNCLGRIVTISERVATSAKLKGRKRSPEAVAKHLATCAAKRAVKAQTT